MKNRLNSIDILRGIAVLLMVFGHIYYRWLNTSRILFEETIIQVFLLAPPFFLVVSGMSFYIFINHMKDNGIPKTIVFYEVFKRALFIFVFSTVIQLLFGFTYNMKISFILYWSIFQIIAFSMILFYFMLFAKQFLRICLYFILIILIFALEYFIKFHEITILYIFIRGDAFSFIPWSNFFILGLFLSDILYNFYENRTKGIMIIFLFFGVIALFLWIFWIRNSSLLSFSTFLMSIGVFLLLFPLCYYYTDFKKHEFIFMKTIILWGKLAFSIYYIQFAILIVGMMTFLLIIKVLSFLIPLPYHFITIVILFFLLIELFLIIWRKFNYKFGVEWLMNYFSRRTYFTKRIIS